MRANQITAPVSQGRTTVLIRVIAALPKSPSLTRQIRQKRQMRLHDATNQNVPAKTKKGSSWLTPIPIA
jgi:hypothetical protein